MEKKSPTDEEIRAHHVRTIEAFGEIMQCEQSIANAKAKKKSVEFLIKTEESLLEKAWEKMAAIMNETGETEIILPGEATDFQIYQSPARESVNVANIDAVPEEYIRIKKELDKLKIGDHLEYLRESKLPPVNWASLEKGTPKYTWRSIKKRAFD